MFPHFPGNKDLINKPDARSGTDSLKNVDKSSKKEAVDTSLTSVDEKSKSANQVDLIAHFMYYG